MRVLAGALIAAISLALTSTVSAQDDRLARLPEEFRSWLEDDVAYIITEKERDVFLSLETSDERKAFIDVFWNRRDPVPATPQNEFKDEHYERLEYADRHFTDIASRPGRKTDRGRMYVILGPPEGVDDFDNYNEIFASQVWFYHGDTTKGIPAFFYLLFYRPQGVGQYRLYSPVLDTPMALMRGAPGTNQQRAFDNLYRISPELARASITFDATGPANFNDISAARLGTEQMLARIEDSPKRAVRTDYIDGWLRYGKRVSAAYSFNYVPNRSTFAVMLGPDGSRFLQYAIELDFENFPIETDEARTKYYTTVDVSLEIRNREGALVLSDDKESYVELSRTQIETGSGESFSYQDGIPVIPGDYNVSVILRNRVMHQYTVAERDIVIEPWSEAEPTLGDIVLGFQVDEEPSTGTSLDIKTFEAAGLRVQPATNGLFAIGDTAHVFFQVVSPGVDDRLRITLAQGDTVFRERQLPAADFATQPVNEVLDLSNLQGGDYQVKVQLLDGPEGPNEGRVLVEKTAALTLSPRTRVNRPGFFARRSFAIGEPGMLEMTLGDQLWSLGRYDEARENFEAAVAANNPNLPMAKWKLAGALVRAREPDRALELLLPLEEEFSEQYEVVLGLGLSYYIKGQLEEAARHLEHATEIRPAGTSLLNALGDIYVRTSKPADARRVLEKSLELDPSQESIKKKVASLPKSE
jgi:GWxTD domain-containing protein